MCRGREATGNSVFRGLQVAYIARMWGVEDWTGTKVATRRVLCGTLQSLDLILRVKGDYERLLNLRMVYASEAPSGSNVEKGSWR